MEIGSLIDWIVGMPVIVLILAISLWWLLGLKDKGLCPKCNAPRIFGDKCISCGALSIDSTKK